jgi:hypothetical protein
MRSRSPQIICPSGDDGIEFSDDSRRRLCYCSKAFESCGDDVLGYLVKACYDACSLLGCGPCGLLDAFGSEVVEEPGAEHHVPAKVHRAVI